MLDILFTAFAWLIGLSLMLWLGVLLLLSWYVIVLVRDKRHQTSLRE